MSTVVIITYNNYMKLSKRTCDNYLLEINSKRKRVKYTFMNKVRQWEYASVPLIIHSTKSILDQWGEDGWELVSVVSGLTSEHHVAYLKRLK